MNRAGEDIIIQVIDIGELDGDEMLCDKVANGVCSATEEKEMEDMRDQIPKMKDLLTTKGEVVAGDKATQIQYALRPLDDV